MSAQQSACAGAGQYRNKFPCNLGGAVVAQSGFGRISGDRKAPPETKLFHNGSPHAAAMPSLIDKDGHIAKRAKITPAPPAATTLNRAVLGVLLRQDAVAEELVQNSWCKGAVVDEPLQPRAPCHVGFVLDRVAFSPSVSCTPQPSISIFKSVFCSF